MYSSKVIIAIINNVFSFAFIDFLGMLSESELKYENNTAGTVVYVVIRTHVHPYTKVLVDL